MWNYRINYPTLHLNSIFNCNHVEFNRKHFGNLVDHFNSHLCSLLVHHLQLYLYNFRQNLDYFYSRNLNNYSNTRLPKVPLYNLVKFDQNFYVT